MHLRHHLTTRIGTTGPGYCASYAIVRDTSNKIVLRIKIERHCHISSNKGAMVDKAKATERKDAVVNSGQESMPSY